jgi:hypothetical protein
VTSFYIHVGKKGEKRRIDSGVGFYESLTLIQAFQSAWTRQYGTETELWWYGFANNSDTLDDITKTNCLNEPRKFCNAPRKVSRRLQFQECS